MHLSALIGFPAASRPFARLPALADGLAHHDACRLHQRETCTADHVNANEATSAKTTETEKSVDESWPNPSEQL